MRCFIVKTVNKYTCIFFGRGIGPSMSANRSTHNLHACELPKSRSNSILCVVLPSEFCVFADDVSVPILFLRDNDTSDRYARGLEPLRKLIQCILLMLLFWNSENNWLVTNVCVYPTSFCSRPSNIQEKPNIRETVSFRLPTEYFGRFLTRWIGLIGHFHDGVIWPKLPEGRKYYQLQLAWENKTLKAL